MKTWIAALVGALALAWMNGVAGAKGIYLFDEGIFYQYGWLVKSGLRPFVDFQTPVTPLCGLVTALGYSLFGVTHQAGVWMVSLCLGAGFIFLCRVYASLVALPLALFFSATLMLSSLFLFQVPAYNQLCAYLGALLASQLIKRALLVTGDERENREAALSYFFIGLITLAKFHVGALFFVICVVFDALDRERFTKNMWRSLAFRLAPLAAGSFIFLAWIRFDLSSFVRNVLMTSSPYPFSLNRPSLNYLLDWSLDILSQPQMTLVFFGVVFGACALWAWSSGVRDLRIRRLITLGAGLFVMQAFVAINSGEAPSVNSAYGAMLVILAYFILRLKLDESSGESIELLPLLFTGPLLAAVAAFSMQYGFSGIRKSWDERKFDFYRTYGNEATEESSIPFFASVQMTRLQKANLELIYGFARSHERYKMFFGPELEMMYPALNKLPPPHWPVWSHPGVTYRAADPEETQRLLGEFQRFDPDIVLMSTRRAGLIAFALPYISQRYVVVTKQDDPNAWVAILVKPEVVKELQKQ